MDELSKTLVDLQNKAENCSKSDRVMTLDFLKKLINNLENVKDDATDGTQEGSICCIKKNDSTKDVRHKLPLKLTIRKFKTIESSFLCHDCKKTFISMKKMVSHIVTIHSKSEVTCIICKGIFYCYNLFIIHECLCPMQSFFIHRQCGVCDKVFSQKREYHLHMKEEHALTLEKISKSFSCHICQMNFQLRSQLLVHSSQVHTEACPKEEVFTNKFSKVIQNGARVDNETTASSTPKQKTVIKSRNWCTVCKRNFLSQKALNKHFLSYMHKVNTGEMKMFKKFVCDVCDNSFNKMICLQRHVSSHHNDFAHKCNLCDYRTSEKCNLTEHMRRHYQIRNFACEFCDARFIAKRELKDHVAFKHNSLRPFECLDCGKMFKTKRILRRHIKTHSEFRPYACACGSSFLRMTNLRRHHLTVHHESNPTITKVHVSSDAVDSDQSKDYWYADSKLIKNKKTTPLTLNIKTEKESLPARNETLEPPKVDTNIINVKSMTNTTQNMQMLNVNYVLKVSTENDKDSKMYWSVNQNFLDPSDMQVANQSVDYSSFNGIISNKSSLHDSSVIDDSLNICDLVSSPSYPLLVSGDQCDDPSSSSKISYDISSLKADNISKYQVDSIMMEPETRHNMDGIWRPIDTLDHRSHSIMDDPGASSMSSASIDMFPQNPGLISSFNEVFLTSVSSNNGYPDDGSNGGHWNSLSLANPLNGYSAESSDYMYATCAASASDSACEPSSADNFLYYNQPLPPPAANPAQQPSQQQPPSFAYIESYSHAGLDHNYGSDSFSAAAFSPRQYQQQPHSHMPDLFSLSYQPSTASCTQFLQAPPANLHSSSSSSSSSIPSILFSQDQQQLFSQTASSLATAPSNNAWIHSQQSPISDFPPTTVIIDPYKSSGSHLPVRILSPIDFFVSSEGVFSSVGVKHEYCLGHNPLLSDCCSQSHHLFPNSSSQLCSKNFSVVNLISTAAAAASSSSKDPDDGDLLFSTNDDSVL